MKKDIWDAEVVGAIVVVAFSDRSMEERIDCMEAITNICRTVKMDCADIGEKYGVPRRVIEHITVAALVNDVSNKINEKEINKLIEKIDSLPLERIEDEKFEAMIAEHKSKRKFN